jgi:hypothetical protein
MLQTRGDHSLRLGIKAEHPSRNCSYIIGSAPRNWISTVLLTSVGFPWEKKGLHAINAVFLISASEAFSTTYFIASDRNI